MTDDFKTTQDILKEVSEELGISKTKVSLVYDSILSHLRDLVNKTNATCINLPYVGLLHVKVGHIRRKLNKAKSYGNKNRVDILQSKLDKIEKFVQKVNEENEGFILNRHYQKERINRKYFNRGKLFEELEEFQNNGTL